MIHLRLKIYPPPLLNITRPLGNFDLNSIHNPCIMHPTLILFNVSNHQYNIITAICRRLTMYFTHSCHILYKTQKRKYSLLHNNSHFYNLLSSLIVEVHLNYHLH